MKLFLYLRFIKACWAAVRDPSQTEQIAKSSDFLANPKNFALAVQEMQRSEELREWYAKKPNPPLLIPEKLKLLPPESFGYAVYNHLHVNNLDPLLFPLEPVNDIEYVRNYYRRSHDIWHVATGYTTSIPDELALMSFTFAQNRTPAAVLILVLGLLHGVLFKNHDLATYVDKIAEGWRRGNLSKKLMAVNWDEMFQKPLSVVREELRLSSPRATGLNSVDVFA